VRRFATTPHPVIVLPSGSKWRAQLDKRDDAPGVQLWGVADGQPEGSNGGFLLAGQGYTPADKVAVLEWLIQRERGYVLNVPWHAIGCLHDGRPIPPPTPATKSG
jgi:hypothetical protein